MRKTRCTLLVLLASLVVALPAWSDEVRAIWVWEEETFRLLDDAGWRSEILTRLREDRFDTLYLYADEWKGRSPIADEPQLYATLVEEARGMGFRVEALLGSAYLGTNRYVMPDRREAANAMIERVLAYNRRHDAGARFDAIHLDIEPYTIPEWKSDRAAVAGHFVDAATEWSRLIRENGDGLEVGAAIPFWFEKVERKDSSLADALLEAFDYVALMDYRDRAVGRDGIIEHARYEIDVAERLGRRVVVGLETDEAELDKLTFAEEGREALEREVIEVRKAFRQNRAFGGIAIHHLRSWLAMK